MKSTAKRVAGRVEALERRAGFLEAERARGVGTPGRLNRIAAEATAIRWALRVVTAAPFEEQARLLYAARETREDVA